MGHQPIQRRFGTRLRKLRQRAGYSQDELAFRSKLTRSYLCQIEAGTRNPTLVALEKLSRGLSVPLQELLHLD